MTKAQIQTLVFAIAAALVLSPSSAFAYNWVYVGDQKELTGTTGEEEGDTDFRATCKPHGKAEIGIGAAEDVGTGKGEAVSVTLANADGTLTIHIAGISKPSPNFQMTGGVELVAAADKSHGIFELLSGAGTIKVTGTAHPASWPDNGRAAATKKFIKACFGG